MRAYSDALEVRTRVMCDAGAALESRLADRYYSDPSPSERDAHHERENDEARGLQSASRLVKIRGSPREFSSRGRYLKSEGQEDGHRPWSFGR